MAAKGIYEAKGKSLLSASLGDLVVANKCASVNSSTDWEQLQQEQPWLLTSRLIAKPDQMIKRRGKLGLIKINATLGEVKQWIQEKLTVCVEIGRSKGYLKTFIIEPFVPHEQSEESYVCIYSHRYADTILFYHEGGVDIGDVDAKAVVMDVEVGADLPTTEEVTQKLLTAVQQADVKLLLAGFIVALYNSYRDLFFTYLEINPLVITGGKIYILDLAAKLDQCAEYLCKMQWGDVEYPAPFGRDAYPEEAYIQDLDSKSGASLKLTILNREGRIWTMVAGGGASVVYADTICDMGGTSELANYGEYSGAPSESQTYEYAKTLLSLMTTSAKHPEGKVLIIGGGIANFTNVAATFKGIVKALREYQLALQEHHVKIYVRRAGPNYQEGLRIMREMGQTLGLPLEVFGPETHMTAIVGMALGHDHAKPAPEAQLHTTANFLLPDNDGTKCSTQQGSPSVSRNQSAADLTNSIAEAKEFSQSLFTPKTRAIVLGMQNRAVQGMLDFDHVCSRATPSVVAMTYPLIGDHKQKFYWGHKEILLPIYKKMSDAMSKHPEASVLVNFASLRSAYESTMEALEFPQIRCIAIIAEGIPENKTREIIRAANKRGVTIIGPATVGGIKPGCLKIGNTGGMMDNILSSKLYRSGCVAYVSRSGGMSNELNNIIAHNADGVFEGVAIGGDRYPGSTFMDHILRYQAETNVHIIVVLGEVGGREEYEICKAIKDGRISKKIICWCIGTCAKMFNSDVQFGHAGASANADSETATAKNVALKAAGAYVPASFNDLGQMIKQVYRELLAEGVVKEQPDVAPPTVPMDFNWARELGLIRKPASFMTSICDERGQELLYSGIPITDIFKDDLGVGGVLGLLWFQRRLPAYGSKFIEMILMVTADHGPAVSGAHNTIVCARAGKDLVSSLTSGLLTIGDRFGGALDGAAKQFTEAFDTGLIPMEFVNGMRKKGQLIMGIGHRVKSINNPDMRVKILKEYVKEHFPATPLLDYAMEVEKITTSKKPNLILNVDGFVAVAMVDLLRNCGLFTREEATDLIENGVLNGLFVLGRTMGFIGHYLDQRRLKQGLYRHPWDDISYVMPEQNM